MKTRWYVNWLFLITMFLVLTSLVMLFLSYREDSNVSCTYEGGVYSSGDSVVVSGSKCLCNDNGNIVCNEDVMVNNVSATDFTSVDLSFSYDSIGIINESSSFVEDVKFVDISQKGSNLSVTLERKSFCNDDGLAAPQIGVFKKEEKDLILRVATNLINTDFSIPCVVENKFEISNMPDSFSPDFSVVYQDEFSTVTNSNNCVYEGKLRNDGDAYQSVDKCSLCTCKAGFNSCELDCQ